MMKNKRGKDRNQIHFKSFVLIFDLILTACLTLLVTWQGWIVTKKFISRPQKTSISYRGLEDIPPIAISVCYVLQVADCSAPIPVFNLFTYYYSYYDTADEECTWKEGEIGSYAKSSKTLWEEVGGRKEPVTVEKLVHRIEVWDSFNQSWQNILTHNNTSIGRTVWPFGSSEVQICNTITNPIVSQLSYLKITPKIEIERKNKKLLYFHPAGQFIGPVFKQDLFILEHADYIYSNVFYELSLQNIKTISTEENPCDADWNIFDSCVTAKSNENTLKKAGCLPSFLDVCDADSSCCLNNSLGTFAYETFVSETDTAKSKCLPPCTTNKVELWLKNHQNMMDNFKNDFHRSFKEYCLFLSLPTLVEVIETKESYNWISFVAEFSGWLGLFLGISVPHLLRLFDIFSDIKMRLIKVFLILIKYLAYVSLGIMFSQPLISCIATRWSNCNRHSNH